MKMVLMGAIDDRSWYMVSPDLRSMKQLLSSRDVQSEEPRSLLRTMDAIPVHPRTTSSNQSTFSMKSDYPASESSLTSGESDDSSSTSSTSRKRMSKERNLRLRKKLDGHRQIPAPIHVGYSLSCHVGGDDRSLSSLSGYGTDYSTSDGSVGFEGLCDAVEGQEQTCG